MDDDLTYLKLYRKMLDSQVFNNEGLLKVWIWCLCKASFKRRFVSVKIGTSETEVEIFPGQFIFGRNKAAKKLKMKASNVRNRIEKLKKLKNLDIKSNTHYSIITILNWETYQGDDNKKDNQEDYRRTTGGLPEDTNKNVKECKECLCIEIPLKDNSIYKLDLGYCLTLKNTYQNINIKSELKKIAAWNLSNPSKRKTKTGIKRHINSWMNRAKKTISEDKSWMTAM